MTVAKEKSKETEVQSLTRKQQVTILKRLFHYAKFFKVQFFTAIVFAILLSIINVLLPRMLQYYMDHFLVHQSTGVRIVLIFATVYFIGTIIKAIVQFRPKFCLLDGSRTDVGKNPQ